MIIVTLMGGLGNQMFQYALGRRLSLLRNTSLQLDLSFIIDESLNHTLRKYELAIFNLQSTIATERALNKFRTVQSSRVRKKIQSIFPFIFPYHIINEQKYSFALQILNSPKNSWLRGYWQTEKYFSEIAEIIRKDFSFPPITDDENKMFSGKINSCNSIGIHIRRGDYISNPETNQFHGVCGIDYYNSAIKLISEKIDGAQLFIFSDDMDWVKQNLITDLPTEYITHNKAAMAYIDMQLMSLCKHNIIANSSFSWWAAWLNSNSGKIIIAPEKWFNDTTPDTSNVIPENWLKL